MKSISKRNALVLQKILEDKRQRTVDVLSEDFLRGVPEFLFREAVSKFVNEIKKHIKNYINANVNDETEKREALDALSETFDNLDKETFELLEEKLGQFLKSF